MGPLLAALGLVFLAELGDKTQLVALGFGAKHKLGPVMAGVVAGYAVSNLVSVVIGGVLGAALPTRAIGLAGGLLFLGFAAWNLRPEVEDEGAGPAEAGAGGRAVVVTVAVAMFVAELGDKTMLTTATLAAQGNPVLVWVGATVGIVASGFVGVLVGRRAGAHLPERAIQLGSSALFAAFGIGLVVTNL